ncbi:MAG: type II secretion system minor pseudopilin GspH [Pseudomonadota bacterium]|nr:type II secretion system minor pseudopilin GspH [Pseudomonadota bacterium]
MRISATGRRNPRALGFRPLQRSAENGFTLIELMIVMTIIGLMSTAVLLAMPDSRGSLRSEAERFAARAGAARDQAVLDSRPMAVRVTAAGYAFDRRQNNAWQPLESRPFATYQWSEGTIAAVRADDAARIAFDSTGMADPAEIILRRDDEQIAVDVGFDGKVQIRG